MKVECVWLIRYVGKIYVKWYKVNVLWVVKCDVKFKKSLFWFIGNIIIVEYNLLRLLKKWKKLKLKLKLVYCLVDLKN